jgi:hypothetical protein
MEKQTEISSVSPASGFNPKAGATESLISAQTPANDETKSINSFDKTQTDEITQFAQKITYASRAASLKSKPSKPTMSHYPSMLSFGSFADLADTILKTTVNAGSSNRDAVDNLAASAEATTGKEPVTFHDQLDQTNPQLNPFSEDFNAYIWAKHLVNAKIRNPERYPSRSAGISFENLGAYGYSRGTDYQANVLNTVMKLKSLFSNRKGGRVEILRNFNGVVKKGETCVVLGRPGR